MKKTRNLRRPGAMGLDVIRVALTSRTLLASCYMPRIKGGGLFVPTQAPHTLGDTVCLAVSLMDAPMVPVLGRVVWVTPAGAVGHRPQGLGVQFIEDAQAGILRQHIQQLLPPEAERIRRHTF